MIKYSNVGRCLLRNEEKVKLLNVRGANPLAFRKSFLLSSKAITLTDGKGVGMYVIHNLLVLLLAFHRFE